MAIFYGRFRYLDTIKHSWWYFQGQWTSLNLLPKSTCLTSGVHDEDFYVTFLIRKPEETRENFVDIFYFSDIRIPLRITPTWNDNNAYDFKDRQVNLCMNPDHMWIICMILSSVNDVTGYVINDSLEFIKKRRILGKWPRIRLWMTRRSLVH